MINSLGSESWVNKELANLGIAQLENVTPASVCETLSEFQTLTARDEPLSACAQRSDHGVN